MPPLNNPVPEAGATVEVTDSREPLFGRSFQLQSVARTCPKQAHVFVRTDEGIVLRVPLRATNLSPLVDTAPKATLSRTAVAEFLDLVKEYELWQSVTQEVSVPKRRRRTSGKTSKKESGGAS